MLGPPPVLRQLDHNTLEEVTSPEEAGKRHQCHRGFQTIDLVLRDPQLSVKHGLHEVSYGEDPPPKSAESVPATSVRFALRAISAAPTLGTRST